MTEERRQKLLEHYGIGVIQLVYHPNDSGMWYGLFRFLDAEYETDNLRTRREAEDRAIAEYESLCETGEK